MNYIIHVNFRSLTENIDSIFTGWGYYDGPYPIFSSDPEQDQEKPVIFHSMKEAEQEIDKIVRHYQAYNQKPSPTIKVGDRWILLDTSEDLPPEVLALSIQKLQE